MKIPRLSQLAAAALAVTASLQADTLSLWDFTGSAGNETTWPADSSAAGITASSLSRGSGITASSAANGFSASGWTTTSTVDANDYFEFSVTVDSATTVDLDSVSFAERRSGTGIRNLVLRSSLDGFAADTATAISVPDDTATRDQTISLPPSFDNLTATTVTFRIYGYASEASGGTWRLANHSTLGGLVVEGTVSTSGPDTTSPSITALSPADDAVDVSLTPTLTITFDENVVAGTGVISLFDSANPSTAVETFDVTTAVTFTGTTASFTPAALSSGTTYHVQIPAGAILDTASPANDFDGIADTTTWSFTTIGPDETGPVVVTLSPADGSLVEGTPAEMSVTFDEIVQAGTGLITLHDASDDTVLQSFDVTADVLFFNDQILFYPTVSLAPGGNYYVQIPATAVTDTALALNAFDGILDTTTWSFSLKSVPALTLSGPYTQDFSTFTSATTLTSVSSLLPEGWSVTGPDLTYDGDWGTGTTGGFRGNASVFGYQHTGSTGVVEQKLTLLNDTGAEITDLIVSYTAKRINGGATGTIGRFPPYTVTVDGNTIAGLAYTRTEGTSVAKSASISGLSIAAGATFTIVWTSDRDLGSGATGSSQQVGISDVSVEVGSSLFPPVLGGVSAEYSTLTSSEVTISADVTGDGGSPITVRGLVYAEAAINAAPEIGGTGVTNVPDAAPTTGVFSTPLSGLTPGTEYAIRAYATNAEGTTYSSVISIFTLAAPPSFVADYSQPFDNFSGSIVTGNLPAGWSVVSSGGINGFAGTWGPITSSGGLLGNVDTPNGVLGYQHVGASGVVTVSLTLTNDTGATIDELYLSYIGRVDRATESRAPEWTVSLDGAPITELTYSTTEPDETAKSHLVTGLSIAPGATFTLTWESDGNVGTGGARRQIGIADVYVALDAPPAGGYTDWALNNGIVGGVDDDDDNDGVSNILEYALGLTPGAADTLAGSFDGSTLSFTAGAEAVAGGDLTYTIETSADLGASGPWTTVATGLDVNNVISYTLPSGTRLFARLRVTQN